MKAPIPANERERLEAVKACQLLDTAPEDAYDRITRLVAEAFSTPIAALSLLDEERQFFKSILGMDVRQTSREIAFCAHAILGDEPLVVLDAERDPRFSDNPCVTGEPGIRFYCGVPVRNLNGLALGVLCAIDTAPRMEVPERLLHLLREFAAQASTEIAHRQESIHLTTISSILFERERELEHEKELRQESEGRAALALEAGRMGCWEWNAVERRIVLSPVMEELLGYSAAQTPITFAKCLKAVYLEDRAQVRKLIRNPDRERPIVTVEFRIVDENGEIRWLALRGRYLQRRDGRLVGANGVCWDVTERHEAEKKLRANEEIFRGISSSSPVGIFRGDLAGNVLYANERLQEIFGMTEDEILGRGWLRCVHPEEHQSVLESIARASETGTYQREYKIQLPGGAVRWLHGRSSLLRDNDGIPIGKIGTVDDITDRKRLEEEQHASQELTRRLLESSADCINVLDREGNVLSMSPGGRRGLGITDPQALLGSDYFSLWRNEAEREAAKAAFRTALGGSFGSFQGELPNIDGDLLWWDTLFSPIFDQTGTPERILAVSRDMTELRRASVQQERARQSAEEANQAKSLFLANVSHELRTPLNGVLGMTDVLLGSGLTAEQHELAAAVKQSGAALLALVDDLLDLGRMESGKLACKREPFGLKRTLDQAIELVAAAAVQKGLSLSVNHCVSLPDILLGDRDRLRQILINYLNNAIKFTDRGGVTVRVASELSQLGEAELLIEVIDTGKGIPEEAHKRLFLPFRQVDASSTRKYGGLGLGLALSKGLAEVMGGSVGLRSSPGAGSTFWLKLPLISGGECSESVDCDPLAGAIRNGFDSLRVLVAEDNLINQKIALRFLAKLGCTPDVVPDGAAAVRLFEQNTYDLVLMDCQMPHLDGYEATEQIRRLERLRRGRRTPVIALTAHAMPGDRKRCLDSGMDDYLIKPVSLLSLKNALEKWQKAEIPVELSQ